MGSSTLSLACGPGQFLALTSVRVAVCLPSKAMRKGNVGVDAGREEGEGSHTPDFGASFSRRIGVDLWMVWMGSGCTSQPEGLGWCDGCQVVNGT